MPAITCVCGYRIEGGDEEELFRGTRAHTDEAHAELRLPDERVRDFVARQLQMVPSRPRLTQIGEPEVREMTPALLDDYLHFFDRDAFTDNPGWAGCYCLFYHYPGTQEEWNQRLASENRAGIRELIRAGKAHGYHAFVDGEPAGWCHATPRGELPQFERFEQFRVGDSERVGSIVCFVIAPPYRRHGIARRLLDAACDGFRRRGLAFAEAYPAKNPDSDARAYHGPLRMYLAAGFAPLRETEDYVIVRKPLQEPS